MKIGVIGYTGFIGTNLKSALQKLYAVESISLRNSDWASKIEGCNVLINLVGKAHDHKGTASEQDYYYSNLDLTQKIFESFLTSPAELLIHISSIAAVEEFESKSPLTETNDCSPSSFYGKSKRAAEEWLLTQDLPKNKKIIILRPPMVHGPGDKGNLGLLYKFIVNGIPYPLLAYNNQRSLISIENFVYFINEIINKQTHMETGIYHLADDEALSTFDIIQVIQKETNKSMFNLAIPKFIIRTIAKVGDYLPIPLNSKRLKKMTSDLVVSNAKLKSSLHIDTLPLTAREGLAKTIKSFNQQSS